MTWAKKRVERIWREMDIAIFSFCHHSLCYLVTPCSHPNRLLHSYFLNLSNQSYLDYLTQLEELIYAGNTEKFRPFDPASGCLVTNISRLPVDKLNFGTGSPDLIFPLTIEKNAAAVLAKEENFVLRFAF